MGKRPEPPADEGESWLVSYADMMTLIACFFILMMAFANYDPVGFNEKAEQFSKNFRKDKNKSSEVKLKQMKEELSRHENKNLKISVKDSELIVTFSTNVVFANGETELEEGAKETLDSMIDIILTVSSQYRIFVEGHADDNLDKSSFKDQRMLSLVRAAKVAKRFEYYGFPPDNIVPIGRADHRKLEESIDEKGVRNEDIARQNRRVVIRVLEPYQRKKLKMGFGVFFKDAEENVKESELNAEDAKSFDVD